jgi:uncharacterized protein (DUF305 family)
MRSPKRLVRSLALLASAAAFCAAGASFAQQPGHEMPMPAATGQATAQSPMMRAMDAMNKAMAAAPTTGNTDQDFVAMMIPHHQGAIDMAKAELAGGKDPELRGLARNIIAAQQREIREMKKWQAKHAAKPR